MEIMMKNRLNHNFLERNFMLILKMKRKMGGPALVFEIISIEGLSLVQCDVRLWNKAREYKDPWKVGGGGTQNLKNFRS